MSDHASNQPVSASILQKMICKNALYNNMTVFVEVTLIAPRAQAAINQTLCLAAVADGPIQKKIRAVTESKIPTTISKLVSLPLTVEQCNNKTCDASGVPSHYK